MGFLIGAISSFWFGIITKVIADDNLGRCFDIRPIKFNVNIIYIYIYI